MTTKIAEEIQQQQNHGRAKYGSGPGPDDLAHDDEHTPEDWAQFIYVNNARAFRSITPEQLRAGLIKVAGLAISAVEAIDRKAEAQKA